MKHLLLLVLSCTILISCSKDTDENGYRTHDPYVQTNFSTGYTGCGETVVTMNIKSNTNWDIAYTNSTGSLKIISVSPIRGKGNAQVKIKCGARSSNTNMLSNRLEVYYTNKDGQRKYVTFSIISQN